MLLEKIHYTSTLQYKNQKYYKQKEHIHICQTTKCIPNSNTFIQTINKVKVISFKKCQSLRSVYPVRKNQTNNFTCTKRGESINTKKKHKRYTTLFSKNRTENPRIIPFRQNFIPLKFHSITLFSRRVMVQLT